MKATSISTQQLKRLQTLYSQFARAAVSASGPSVAAREQRLIWAALLVNRVVTSFSTLTGDEADKLIAWLTSHLPSDSAPPAKSGKPKAKRKPRPDREQAERCGKDGRWDGTEFRRAPQLCTAQELDTIDWFRRRLDWSREQFDAWLRSPRSPLGRHSNPQIRTLAQANRVRWALKRMLQKSGLWEKEEERRAS